MQLLHNAINILSQAYNRIGEMGSEIREVENSPEEPKRQETRIIASQLYETIMAQLILNDEGDVILGVIGDNLNDLNELILWLKKETAVSGMGFPTPLRTTVVTASAPAGPAGESVVGPPGADGAAYNFSQVNLGIGIHEIDRVAKSAGRSATWEYNIYDSTSDNQRTGTLKGHWNTTVRYYAERGRPQVIGTNPPVTLSLEFDGDDIVLYANISSGTWIVDGERKFTPTNGSFVQVGTQLAQGFIFMGGTGNVPTMVQVSGVIVINEFGVASFSPLVIDNSHIKADAGIEFSKMEVLTPNIGLGTDDDGRLTALTGAISNLLFSNLDTGFVLVSDSSTGKIIVSEVPVGKLSFIANLLSDAQEQLNNKQDSITGGVSTGVSSNYSTNKLMRSNGSGKLVASTIDADVAEETLQATPQTSPLENLGIIENLTDMALPISEQILRSTGSAATESILAGGQGMRVYLITLDNTDEPFSRDYEISVTEGGVEQSLLIKSVASGTKLMNVVDSESANLPVFTETDTSLKFLLIGAGATLNLKILDNTSNTRFIRCLYAQIPA